MIGDTIIVIETNQKAFLNGMSQTNLISATSTNHKNRFVIFIWEKLSCKVVLIEKTYNFYIK